VEGVLMIARQRERDLVVIAFNIDGNPRPGVVPYLE
jgi:hypothetical protein